ncbi:hypothetical protein ZEAMMB73_Zm00001d042888 [Zea mays]|uniref:Uncharacterized protein n=1 Tax=Zea mays TaxID=4577 RepID=A0A1D6N7C7_MAIZE|nr:hypothetical protein ZEAMMB73_Zm00001d042888 [Zea mays]
MAGEPIATVPSGPESVAEADRLLALAESELSMGRHALRAQVRPPRHPPVPDLPARPVVATAANVLLADASSHHAALLLPEPDDPDASPLSVSELCRHFKSLIKSLRVGLDATTAAAYPSVAAAAEEALGRATKAYEALTAPAPGTFWTACAGCRLLHEFERKWMQRPSFTDDLLIAFFQSKMVHASSTPSTYSFLPPVSQQEAIRVKEKLKKEMECLEVVFKQETYSTQQEQIQTFQKQLAVATEKLKVSYLAADQFFPEWNVWTQFLEESTIGFKLDALAGSHPIEAANIITLYDVSNIWRIPLLLHVSHICFLLSESFLVWYGEWGDHVTLQAAADKRLRISSPSTPALGTINKESKSKYVILRWNIPVIHFKHFFIILGGNIPVIHFKHFFVILWLEGKLSRQAGRRIKTSMDDSVISSRNVTPYMKVSVQIGVKDMVQAALQMERMVVVAAECPCEMQKTGQMEPQSLLW